MDLTLNDEQKLLSEAARNFFESECSSEQLGKILKNEDGFSRSMWDKMVELGWAAVTIPEEYGGIGLGLQDLSLIMEEVGRAAAPTPLLTVLTAAEAIIEAGTEEQKQALLPGIASGEKIVALALAEPKADQAIHMETEASETDAGFVLNGCKLFVDHAHVATSLLVVAKTGDVDESGNGISLFMVDTDADGVELEHIPSIDEGCQYAVTFNNVALSADQLVGEKGGAWAAVERANEVSMILHSVELVAALDKMLWMGTDYVKEREQFGKKIGSFQAIQHKLGDIYTAVMAGRWMTYYAIWALQNRRPDASKQIGLAKAWLCEKSAHQCTFGIQQVFGGIGLDMDLPLHFYFNRTRALELSEGGAGAARRMVSKGLGL